MLQIHLLPWDTSSFWAPVCRRDTWRTQLVPLLFQGDWRSKKSCSGLNLCLNTFWCLNLLDYILWLQSSHIVSLVVTSRRATLHMGSVISTYIFIFVLGKELGRVPLCLSVGKRQQFPDSCTLKKYPGGWSGFLEGGTLSLGNSGWHLWAQPSPTLPVSSISLCVVTGSKIPPEVYLSWQISSLRGQIRMGWGLECSSCGSYYLTHLVL